MMKSCLSGRLSCERMGAKLLLVYLLQSWRRYHCKRVGHDWEVDSRFSLNNPNGWHCRHCLIRVWLCGVERLYLSPWSV
jgi:hypothetical protein